MASEETPKAAGRTGIFSWLGAGLVLALVAGGAAAALVALHARADRAAETRDPRPPLPVTVTEIRIENGYGLAETFAGRIEPARATMAAFERSGLVTDVLVEEGDRVSEGDIIARLDREPLEIEQRRLRAERESAVADLKLAEATAERRARLRDQGFETGQSFDEARFQVDAVAARIDTIDARLERIALDLRKSTLEAPFAGTVAARDIDEGAVVEAGTPVVALQETPRPRARVGVPPELAATLEAGEPVTLSIRGAETPGRIAAVSPDLETETRTVSILVDITGEVPAAMGEIARLTLERRIAARGAWVPLTALQEAERGLWSVHVVVEDEEGPVAAREIVEVIHADGARAFVRGSFADGARVVVEGPHRLTLGAPVDPVAAGAATAREG